MRPEKMPKLDELKAYIENPAGSPLTDDLKEYCDRLQTCYDLLRHEISRRLVVKKMLKLFPNISERTAYNDIQNCQKLFAPRYSYDSDFLRNFIVEDALKQIKVATTGKINHKAWADARNALLKVRIMDLSEGDKIDPSLLGGNTYLFVLPGQEALEMKDIEKLPQSKQTDLVMKLFAKDIDEIEAAQIMTDKAEADEETCDD